MCFVLGSCSLFLFFFFFFNDTATTEIYTLSLHDALPILNAVAPSLIQTDMVGAVASSASRIPLGRFGAPEECAQVVMMLVGNEYMTGQTVALSGGLSF